MARRSAPRQGSGCVRRDLGGANKPLVSTDSRSAPGSEPAMRASAVVAAAASSGSAWPLTQRMPSTSASSALAPARSAGYGDDGDVLNVLEAALEGRSHLAGGRFTAVDLYVASSLGYYLQFGLIQPRPAFTAFLSLHTNRPAAQLDNALLPPQTA